MRSANWKMQPQRAPRRRHVAKRFQHSMYSLWGGVGILTLLIVGACCLLFGGLAAPIVAASANDAPPLPAARGPVRTVPSGPLGSPAITVHVATSQNAATAQPAFSVADAADYAATHPMFRTITTGPVTVAKVTFMTSKQLSMLLGGEQIGLPDSAVVCFVEMHGTFTFPAPLGTTRTFHTGFEVFNAHNGYFLMSGGLPADR